MKSKTKWVVISAAAGVLVGAALLLFLDGGGHTDIIVDSAVPRLTVTSTAFEDYGVIPDAYTGHGADISPPLAFSGLEENAVSIAIIMDDLDVPGTPNFTHWVIWNIPMVEQLPEGIPHGASVSELDGAVQGTAYGRNRYRGPMPPFGTHRYQFHVFALDSSLDLDSSCGKLELLDAMEGHIMQYGTITGRYPD